MSHHERDRRFATSHADAFSIEVRSRGIRPASLTALDSTRKRDAESGKGMHQRCTTDRDTRNPFLRARY
jgi:hypothetical protein